MKSLLRNGSVAMTCASHVFLQKWIKKIFLKSIVRRQNRNNLIYSYNLSAHLMNDLGFGRDGNPTQWSTFPKAPPMFHEAHSVKAKRTNLCETARDLNHFDLQSSV
jgi:hypothetical protein